MKLSSAASLLALAGSGICPASNHSSQIFYVSTDGNDQQPGTAQQPFASLERAQQATRKFRPANPHIPVTVLVRAGTYYLRKSLVFTPDDSGTAEAPVVFAAHPGEKVTLSGGCRLNCRWQTRKNKSICDLTDGNDGPFAFSQLFVNNKREVRARFPDYDPSPRAGYIKAVRALPAGTSSPDPIDGAAPLEQGVIGIEFDPGTFTDRRWGKPEEAVIHIFQEDGLGMLEWQIRSIDYDRNRIWFGKGGHQLGDRWKTSSAAVGKDSRFFVDNVLEEMSVPHEWYLSTQGSTLYYRAEEGADIEQAQIEVPLLDQIIRIQGANDQPVEFLSLAGFRFAHTETIYMKPHETSPSGNWAVFRGGAVILEGTRNCSIRDCWFDSLGGNAVFWSGSNRFGNVSGCLFTECGGNAICFAGVRDQKNADWQHSLSDCVASDNIIRSCGVFAKQSAGIYISCAQRITAAHNEIRDMPCSGVFVADGASNGHLIEHNDLLNTAQETSHCGPVQVAGNPRGDRSETAQGNEPHRDETASQGTETTNIRGNLLRGKASAGIRLDQGVTHCDVYNNIAIGSAIRLCSGAHRTIYNNIWFNSSEPVALLSEDSENDRYHHNVAVFNRDTLYDLQLNLQGIQRIREIDYNCVFLSQGSLITIASLRAEGEFNAATLCTLAEWQKLGFDQHSVFSDPLIADPANLDFKLLENSPALKLGFKNFPLHQWGPAKDLLSNWKNL
ncbi:MAG TPA: right-handed parallel beta-helix repeat-containing protein [Terracidiphilus sp.]